MTPRRLALGLIALFVAALKINVGVPPTIIVGGSALVGFFCWRATNLRGAITPVATTILFLTCAGRRSAATRWTRAI